MYLLIHALISMLVQLARRNQGHWGPFYYIGLPLITTKVINYVPCLMKLLILSTGCTIEVWEWIYK